MTRLDVNTLPDDRLANEGDDLIDLRELIAVFRRRLRTLIGVAALVFALVVLITFQMTPKFTAVSEIMIDPQQSQVIDFEAVMSGLSADSAVVDTEVQVISSRSMAEAVAVRLNLVADPEFNGDLVTPEGLAAWIANTKSFIRSLVPTQINERTSFEDVELRTLEATTDAVLDNLSVRRSGLTYIIDISFTSEHPRRAAEIANAFAEEYLLAQLESKFDATERANEWLNERVSALREQVRSSEQAVEVYRTENGLIDAQGVSLNEQQISDINTQIVIQRQGLAEARARLDGVTSALERGAQADTIGEVLASEVIRDLRRQQAEVSRRRSDLATRYGARHPEILTVEREQADIQSQIEQETQRIISSLRNEVAVARQRLQSLEVSLNAARNAMNQDNSALVRLRELQREADSTRALFEAFLNRFRQTTQQESLTDADARIVSRASIPSQQSAPNVMLNLALGIVLGGIAGVGVIFLLAMLDTGIRTEDDIERKIGVPHVASIAFLGAGMLRKLVTGKDPAAYIRQKPLSAFAEAFRNLRSSIKFADIDQTPKVIVITSALPGEGKTTVSECLAMVSAMSETRTIIVDCDLRRRQMTLDMRLTPDVGLVEVLAGDASLDDAIVPSKSPNLAMLPLVKADFSPRDLFGTVAFDELLVELRDRYDLVILDTAPVLAVTDTKTIARKADGTVFVVRWRKTAAVTARRAIESITKAHGRVFGVALNQIDLKAQSRYGYGASGYYYRSYQRYYSN
jgi:succinoglycan biosynthesis transport protein ExoP